MKLDTTLARCTETDPEIFFTEKAWDNIVAREVCKRCPIMEDCLDSAMEENMPYGIWGGATPQERTLFKRNPKAKLRHIYITMGRKIDDFLEKEV